MREDVDHLVLTRFSARFLPEQEPPDEDWLWYRLGFFADACVPSMRAQTVQDFRWLVWLDPRCSEDFRLELEDLARDTFEPIWTTDVFWSTYRGEVAARTSAAYLITTRLDNDDAVARDFVEAIQDAFTPTTRLAIDFPHGLQVDRSGAVYSDYYPTNHFVSLLERRTESLPATVYVDGHPRLPRHTAVRRIHTEPMWLEVVHGTNLLNTIRGPRVSPAHLDERFEITLPYRRSVTRRTLWAEKARTQAQLTRRRVAQPRTGVAWLRSVGQRTRGSRTIPRQERSPAIVRARATVRRRLGSLRR